MACALIRQVNSEQLLIDHWTFGGGTVLMLRYRHRFSKDAESRVDSLLGLLKSYVVSYWQSRGIAIPQGKGADKSSAISAVAVHDRPETAAMADRDRSKALSLVLKAAAILSRDADDPAAD